MYFGHFKHQTFSNADYGSVALSKKISEPS